MAKVPVDTRMRLAPPIGVVLIVAIAAAALRGTESIVLGVQEGLLCAAPGHPLARA